MTTRPGTVLIVGATGSIGRHAVAEALRQGYTVRALVRDPDRARLLPDGVDLAVGDLTRPETPPSSRSTANRRPSAANSTPSAGRGLNERSITTLPSQTYSVPRIEGQSSVGFSTAV